MVAAGCRSSSQLDPVLSRLESGVWYEKAHLVEWADGIYKGNIQWDQGAHSYRIRENTPSGTVMITEIGESEVMRLLVVIDGKPYRGKGRRPEQPNPGD